MNSKPVIMALALVVGLLMTTTAMAQNSGNWPTAQNLFNNYYTQGANTVNAGMYPAPLPVPARVGHTYYTYQPLYPHEHMYVHRRNYYNYYAPAGAFYTDPCDSRCGAGAALNKTTVVWQAGCYHWGHFPSSLTALQKLHYFWARKHYCLDGGGCN